MSRSCTYLASQSLGKSGGRICCLVGPSSAGPPFSPVVLWDRSTLRQADFLLPGPVQEVQAEPAEPAEPAERGEPAEPAERGEPAEPVELVERLQQVVLVDVEPVGDFPLLIPYQIWLFECNGA